MTETNRKTKEKLKKLSESGFNFSYNKIAEYMRDKGLVKYNGLPYCRIDIFNILKSAHSDMNIETAVNDVLTSVVKGKKRVWKYHRTCGNIKKTKK